MRLSRENTESTGAASLCIGISEASDLFPARCMSWQLTGEAHGSRTRHWHGPATLRDRLTWLGSAQRPAQSTIQEVTTLSPVSVVRVFLRSAQRPAQSTIREVTTLSPVSVVRVFLRRHRHCFKLSGGLPISTLKENSMVGTSCRGAPDRYPSALFRQRGGGGVAGVCRSTNLCRY
jgi:hypothetical protein